MSAFAFSASFAPSAVNLFFGFQCSASHSERSKLSVGRWTFQAKPDFIFPKRQPIRKHEPCLLHRLSLLRHQCP